MIKKILFFLIFFFNLPIANSQTFEDVYSTSPELSEWRKSVFKSLSENLHYPINVKKSGLEAKVIVRFEVGPDSLLKNATILKVISNKEELIEQFLKNKENSIGDKEINNFEVLEEELRQEVIRVIQLLPKYKQKLNNTNKYFTLPIVFKNTG